MELEIITPKKEKKFEPVTIQLTIQTPEEFATLLAVANSGTLDNQLAVSIPMIVNKGGYTLSSMIFNSYQYDQLWELFQQHVTNQSK